MIAHRDIDTIIIGGGQSGLVAGYHLMQRDIPFVILDQNRRAGDSWRERWDSLRLFTPARFNGLDGMPNPAPPHSFLTKDEMAAYLEDYAARFSLPIEHEVRIDRITQLNGGFLLTAAGQHYEASNVIVATGNYQRPRIPDFAWELDPAIVQLHSSEYRNPAQLPDGAVLVVGAGNSGAEISLDLATAHNVYLAGKPTGFVPFGLKGFIGRRKLSTMWFVANRVLTVDTPIGRKVRPRLIGSAGPIVRVKPGDLSTAGVRKIPRIERVEDGKPVTSDGAAIEVASIVWGTGFQRDFSWIDLPGLGDIDQEHHRGIAGRYPGLYFLGLFFQYCIASSLVGGVSRDASYIAEHVAARQANSGSEMTRNMVHLDY